MKAGILILAPDFQFAFLPGTGWTFKEKEITNVEAVLLFGMLF